MLFVSHEIHERERDGILILDVKGRLTEGSHDSALREHLESALEAGKKNIIVNLQQVSEIDTPAVDSIVRYGEEFEKIGGRLALLNPVRDHIGAGELLELDTTLPVYKQEQDAVNSFFPDRKVPHYDLLEFLEEETHHHSTPEEEKQG